MQDVGAEELSISRWQRIGKRAGSECGPWRQWVPQSQKGRAESGWGQVVGCCRPKRCYLEIHSTACELELITKGAKWSAMTESEVEMEI